MPHAYKKHFIPLESDPAIFTSLVHSLGGLPTLRFLDVYALDTATLALIPRPVLALVLVMPSCPAYVDQRDQRPSHEYADAKGGGVVWLKQTIHNACGMYAILHAVCNRPEVIENGSELDRLMKTAPAERVAYLDNSSEIEDAYARVATKGSTKAPDAEAEVQHRYICFVKVADQLYELEGDLDGPVSRGRGAGDDEDVLRSGVLDVIRTYTDSAKDGTFGLLAMVVGEDE